MKWSNNKRVGKREAIDGKRQNVTRHYEARTNGRLFCNNAGIVELIKRG